MEQVEFLIVGAGVSGLTFANQIGSDRNWLCIEALDEPGGYCRTIKKEGFVWDFPAIFSIFGIRTWNVIFWIEWAKWRPR